MDLPLKTYCVVVLAFSVVRACQLNDKPSLSNISERFVNNTAAHDFLNDFQLHAGWYRTTNNGRMYTLVESSSNLSYGTCGTFYPIYLKYEHPNLSSIHVNYTDVKACVYDDKEDCSVEYDLRIRRCGLELEYYFQSALPYSAYCLDPQCEQGFYGPDCQHACLCKSPGTNLCFPDTGECECKSGFNGLLCENDVDECLTDLHNCSRDRACYNTFGSYKCLCRDGLNFDATRNTCILPECFGDTYGINCSLKCQCNTENSIHQKVSQWCNPVLGHCTCKKGWTGFTCDADIDECKDNGDCNKNNSICKNAPGTFSCECNEGYSTLGGNCISKQTANYTAVVISVTVVLVVSLVIAASISLWKCKGIKQTAFRTAPYICTGTGDSSLDLHSNDYSCIDDAGKLQTETENVYERYTQPPENTRTDHSSDIFVVGDHVCSSPNVNQSYQSQCQEEHVYLSLQTQTTYTKTEM